MAVNVTKKGGIYIEIGGTLTGLYDALQKAKAVGNESAAAIAKEFNLALSKIDAGRVTSNISKSFAQAKAAAQGFNADLSAFEKNFRQMGEKIGLAGKQLDTFAAAQAKALQKKNADDFTTALKSIQSQTGMTNAEMNALAKSLGGVGNEFRIAERKTQDMGGCLKTLGIQAYLAKKALDAASAVAGGFSEAIGNAARFETLGVVLKTVGANAGYTADALDAYVSQLRQTGIAGLEARQVATQLVQANIDLAQSSGLARVAQDAAVIANTNSSEAFERMVNGIQAGNTQILRTLGLNVNFERSYKALAQQLGKTTADLSEQEKTQARVNAVMERGSDIAGVYEASMQTAGKQLSSMARYTGDLSTDFGQLLTDILPVVTAIKAMGESVQWVNKQVILTRGNLKGLDDVDMLAAFEKGGLQGMRDFVDGMGKVRTEFGRVREEFNKFKTGSEEFNKFYARFSELDLRLYNGELDAAEIVELREEIRALWAEMNPVAAKAEEAAQATAKLLELDGSKITKTIDDLTFKLQQFKRDAAAQASASALVSLGVDYKDIDSAGQVMAAAMAKYNEETRAAIVQVQNLTRANYEAAEAEKAKQEAARKAQQDAQEAARKAQQDAQEAARKAQDNIKVQKDFWKEYANITAKGYADNFKIQEKALREQYEANVKAGVDWMAAYRVYLEQLKEIAAENPVTIEIGLAKDRLEKGAGNFEDGVNASLGKMLDGYTTAAAGLTEAWGNFFTNFSQGFADSVGRAIVYGDDLKESLGEVARSAVSSLISSLVQLGVQMAVNAALGQSLAASSITASTALGVAQAKALAAAYAPAASAASLASYGANAVPAMAGMESTFALGQLLSSITGFDKGGFTGAGAPNEIAGFVHKNEVVIPSPVVNKIGRAPLESLASGGPIDPTVFSAMPAQWADKPPQIKVSIQNTGTPQKYTAEYVTADEVRLIASDVVQKDTEPLMTSRLNNPNSKFSKALGSQTDTKRRRG